MDIIWTFSNYWFRLPSLESSSFYYDATCLNNWFFKYKTKGNLIYIYKLSFCNLVISYLRYLCSFAFICGIQHILSFFLFFLRLVPNFSGLYFLFIAPSVFSNVYLHRCYLFIYFYRYQTDRVRFHDNCDKLLFYNCYRILMFIE
jgi:hypothetical protein